MIDTHGAIAKTFRLNLKLSERMWRFVSVEAGINVTLEDPQRINYENCPLKYKALCRALAWEAMEEFNVIAAEGEVIDE